MRRRRTGARWNAPLLIYGINYSSPGAVILQERKDRDNLYVDPVTTGLQELLPAVTEERIMGVVRRVGG